ncbi:MAG: exodeoxyribonuclease VII small subunit [Thermoanaerobaculia bacterium]
MTEAKNDDNELTFGEAIAELEEILQRIEGEETEIDELAGQLKRAAGLLDVCRGKIRKAETEVQQIVADLEKSDTATGSSSGEEGAE